MKGKPVDQLVYDYMFPRPKPTDPQNFQALLQRSLIPEVRQETHAFYGHLDTQEAKYPGLDYAHPTHRIRLSRWTWHRRLFRALDGLGLTPSEIAALTKWEGTKWAKEKFEKEQGIIIRDTAADGFPDWADPIDRQPAQPSQQRLHTVSIPSLTSNESMAAEESDEELESVGVALNNRLRAQAARREAGETSVVLDEEWEQWLKNAIETGELALLTERMTDDMFRRTNSSSLIPAALVPAGMLNLARAGQWSDIPEFLQPMLRRTLEAEISGRREEARTSATRSTLQSTSDPTRDILTGNLVRFGVPWPRRTYSDLRLPVGETAANQRTAETSGA
ncbi:hypothetical protein PT974_05942 [Cladobotryum mycophilum]|uniref:Uncharacterized protein n=1 Tax=Cladobotryum mycophilum TaxID=491253 RepID=A0ABR0SK54_9HYPO